MIVETKFIEARDRATCMPLMATRLFIDSRPSSRINRIVRRAGFGADFPYVILTDLNSQHRSTYDPYDWGGSITLQPIHEYLIARWHEVKDGDVIDAEFLRGERDTPRETDL